MLFVGIFKVDYLTNRLMVIRFYDQMKRKKNKTQVKPPRSKYH